METTAENLHCTSCGQVIDLSRAASVRYPAKGRAYSKAAMFTDIYFCQGCQLGVAMPALNDAQIDAIYESGDYWENFEIQDISPRKNPGHYVLARVRLEYILTHCPWLKGRSLSICDIGGGHGFIGLAALQSGVPLNQYCVIEKDKFFRGSLQKTWQKEYPKAPFAVYESVQEAQGEFDIIILSHILEHLNDPGALMQEAARHLSKDGVMFIEVPLRDYLFKDDVFPHVLFFNSGSLEALCKRLGFKVIQKTACGRPGAWVKDQRGAGRMAVRILEQAAYKLRRVLPLAVQDKFYRWLLQPHTPNDEGTWIRIVLSKV